MIKMLYLLLYWNGEGPEDSEERVIGVYSSLDKAIVAATEDAKGDECHDPEFESERAAYYVHLQPVDDKLGDPIWMRSAHIIRDNAL